MIYWFQNKGVYREKWHGVENREKHELVHELKFVVNFGWLLVCKALFGEADMPQTFH